MQHRHQLAATTFEDQPRPGQREIFWPGAKLSHQQRAMQQEAFPKELICSKEAQS